MLKARIWLIVVVCLLSATVSMANVAIDEDFDSGVIFVDQGGICTTATINDPQEQGINVIIDPAIRDGVAHNFAGAPLTFTDDPTIGHTVPLASGGRCYELLAGKVLQFGAMAVTPSVDGTADGTLTDPVNGHIPFWGDGQAVIQFALAVDSAALSQADGTVLGKVEVAYDTAALLAGREGDLKTWTYEVRVDATNHEADVYSIDKNGVAVKVFDGLAKTTNWANITSLMDVRGALLDTASGEYLAAQWGDILGPEGVGTGTPPQKGPAPKTLLASPDAGDTARWSVYVNAVDGSAEPATATGWDADNADGRPDTNAHNNAQVTGVKFTAGAANVLWLDNFFLASDRFDGTDRSVLPQAQLAPHCRLNPFAELVQDLPVPPGPVDAGAKAWELY